MKIVIAGAGEVGSHLAKMLSNEAYEITVIDQNPKRLEVLATNTDIITVEGNPSSIAILREAKVGQADLFIAVNPSESQDVNIISAMLAKNLGAKRVTARINNSEYLDPANKALFVDMGIDLMFYPEQLSANEIVYRMKRTMSADSLLFARGKLQMSAFRVDEESPILDMEIKEFAKFATSEDLLFRVVAISRDNTTILPDVETKFKTGDLIYVICKRSGLEMLVKLLGKETIDVHNVMIIGGSPIGEMLANYLAKDGKHKVVLIDSDPLKCQELSEKLDDKVVILNGDGRNKDFLYDENIHDFEVFISLTKSSETNILSCVAAKKMGVPRTIAEVENLEYIKLAEDMGIDAIINKKLITASKIFKFTLSDKVKFIKYMSGTDAEVLEYTVTKHSKITSGSLMELDFPKGAIIGGIIRGNDAHIAVGSTRIQVYDRVIVFTMPHIVKEVDKFFK